MISLALSIRQDDCPLSAASDAHDVAFVTPHWHYDHDRSQLELRILADAADRTALECGLDVIRAHPETDAFNLLAKQGGTARVHLTMGTTVTMGTVVANGGYLTAPFENVDGRERWQLGFDDERAAEHTLAVLSEHDDEFEVHERQRLDPETVLADVRADAIGTTVLEGARRLTNTERETIRRAVAGGYYSVPRTATLGDLAADLGVSDAAVSKTLRRAEQKLLAPMVGVLESSPESRSGRLGWPESDCEQT
ncbi:HTH-10 family transcription regulator [Natrialba magadii ATCC 43099]|uniref:Bacterio-opsin activator HTH domain-containing protein n=1 Tax=Natrialba magadii (strain ATCC 43099 / DSM 3394 / CCM 3739 / CIP 104546 / IAM 13178 / JCM 8861 / NBRC 102185 / NCIMB 2190 / MS3) TaxID=547559 RepID=D3SRX3_NATMM|nr:helix-turn-helix domain-containing protein [Natrialba magadii]ADD06747.1 HTH-10 family transcription regulator [Natrialba magadii ATCC 43099]ELY27817.1 bacterio-opsin activator HTH domain-containing protein [Natrialba magadii ATCC 43099]